MSAVHEPGEVWHIGWDWFAHMWFVEPPFDVDLDEPMKWFTEREDAFDYVDTWIREQPVQASVVDQAEVVQGFVPEPVDDVVVPRAERSREATITEPPRVLSDVHIPTAEEAQTEQQQRVAAYAQQVGIK